MATSAQLSWPPMGSFVAAYGLLLVAAVTDNWGANRGRGQNRR
jgi:hypothetical protein